MDRHQADQLHGSVIARASQLRAFIQQDIFFEKNSLHTLPEEKAFITCYFRKGGMLKECSQINTTWNVLVDNLSWNDWYDRW